MNITKKHFMSLNLTMGIVFTILLVISYFTLPIYYTQTEKQHLHKEYIKVVNSIKHKNTKSIIKTIEAYEKNHNNIFFTVFNTDEEVIYPDQSMVDSYENSFKLLSKKEIGIWTSIIKTKESKEVIITGEYYLQSQTDISQAIFTIYPVIILLFIFISVIATSFYSIASTKRIKSISRQAKQLRTLEKNLHIEDNGKDEITSLVQDINSLYSTLIKNIEELEKEKDYVLIRERQKIDFLRMASHELKTPITSMLGVVEGMIYGIGDFKNKEKYLNFCHKTLTEQAQFTQSILEVSHLNTLEDYPQEQISLKKILDDLLPTYQLLSTSKNLSFKWEIEDILLIANEFYLKIAIRNLLDNAIRYTKKEGEIILRLKYQKLVISNQAEHLLTEEQLNQIFLPFYRPDFSRNRRDGGTGLGLYIVKKILTKQKLPHKFETIKSNMIFTIDIPDTLGNILD
ncbi:sensor histidine kinase [Streptococcus equinus]|uniref:sensor histidine kinase n=1 Tax=Streptococcus equinus TaxID=1335 RepID=UPI0008C76A58|nr:HAMP domain-containing sensor histidine kinase [Streptococcus equinus]SEI67791.1 two-component system, OmpR family, sensor kinase Ihk [Streptococcus equinus]